MALTVAGQQLKPNGEPLALATFEFTALRNEATAILQGVSTSFETDAQGQYSTQIEMGLYLVRITHERKTVSLGTVWIEDGDATTVNALLAAKSKKAAERIDAALLALLNDAQEARDSSLSAQELAERWASEAEDVEISEGKFSASHYAAKAEEARDQTVAAVDGAVAEATALATAEANRSGQEADRAEIAADNAALNANVFTDTAAGLAGTAQGNYFSVPSVEGDEYLVLYRHDAGSVATEIKRYPNKEAIEKLGFAHLPDDANDLIFAVVDDEGRRTWLEADQKGAPSDWAASKMGGKLSAANAPTLHSDAVSSAVAEVGLESTDANLNPEPVFGITDEQGRRTWLEFDTEGKPTTEAAASIAEKLPANLTPAETYTASHAGASYGIISGPNVVCWGDSMTAGAGGNGTTYPKVLQDLLTAAGYTGTVTNRGVGGESSVTITGRTNATPFMVMVDGGSIPATGQVGLTLRQINGITPAPLKQGSQSYTCTLAGVPGTFGRTVDADGVTYHYHFTRAADGTAATADRPTPLLLDIGEQHRGDIALIWIGQNGPSNARAIQDAKAIIQHLRALDKRFLVISKPGGTSAQDADDAEWFAEFGTRFIAIRQYMVEFGLADADITPTAQDETDMANGTVPSSLRVDAVHWVGAGYEILANVIFRKFEELGWV